MGVGDTNSLSCGMMVAGVEVASRFGGRLVIDRSITPRPASANSCGLRTTPASDTCRRNDRVRDIDIRPLNTA